MTDNLLQEARCDHCHMRIVKLPEGRFWVDLAGYTHCTPRQIHEPMPDRPLPPHPGIATVREGY